MFSRSRTVVATAESKDDGSTEDNDGNEDDSDDEEGNGDTKSHPRPPAMWLVVTNSHEGTEGSPGLVTVAPVIPGDKSPTAVVASFKAPRFPCKWALTIELLSPLLPGCGAKEVRNHGRQTLCRQERHSPFCNLVLSFVILTEP